jgi:hypothetical protein
MRSPNALTFLKNIGFVVILLLAIQPMAVAYAQPGSVTDNRTVVSAPQPLSAASSTCQWTYYPIQGGKLQPEQLLFNDPDQTPIANLSLGNPFKGKSTQLATTGSADFNGDNITDVFRTIPRPDGNLQWQYSSDGSAAWQNLAYAGSNLPISQLQFGEFNSDLNTDVFANQYSISAAAYQWLYSPGGTNSFVTLKSIPFPPDRLALGDFNGDGVTDVFSASQTSSTYQWSYSSAGSAPPTYLAHSDIDPALLRFGDFNGDGTTDVFAATRLPDGSTQWLYSSGGALSYTNLNISSVPYSELKFGDFDGDGKSDVLAALPQADGSLQVVYWSGGLGPALPLGNIPGPAPALRVGDFNGDGVSDLMAYRCGMSAPLTFAPRQQLASSGYNTFYKTLNADVNGDGFPDLIFVSTCQDPTAFGTCATHHLQVAAALGSAFHTDNLTAAHQLGADNLDFTYYKAMVADFNGDGKSDLALISSAGTTLTIYVALSNGDGTFTLGPAQTFGGETWGVFNPTVGDFNGDGKADLSFTTVCAISSGSCSVGDNNSLYVASSDATGTFTMSARQDLGLVGWATYYTYAGDFNGDGKTDLLFNSTCQKVNFIDSTCTVGDANIIYTALSNGAGGFTLSNQQVYGASGWGDYPNSIDLPGDVNGDGRTDLVWTSSYQSAAKTYNQLVVAGFANSNGTFQLGSVQDFGSAWTGRPSLVDLNRDGKADLVWNNAPYNDTDVDTYAAATSNGSGSFTVLGQGSVYTGPGFFTLPDSDAYAKVPRDLTIVSTRQNSISDALFVINSVLPGTVTFLPFIQK